LSRIILPSMQNDLPDLQGDAVKQKRLAKLQASQSTTQSSSPAPKSVSPPAIKKPVISPVQSPIKQPISSPSKQAAPSATSTRFVSQTDDEWQQEVLSKINATDEGIIVLIEGHTTQNAFNSLLKSYSISLKVFSQLI
jgi:hypothetical protein